MTPPGLETSSINPPDAIAALKSFPRRWRSALAVVADDPSAESLVQRRPDASSWSSLEHTWYVADLLGWYHTRVERARADERPALEADDPQRWPAERAYNDRELEQLGEHATGLATTLERLAADDWLRSADVEGNEVTILSMARHAVVEGSDHLRAAERALRAARGRS
jgi:hypothetical protein